MVLFIKDNENTGAAKWLDSNGSKLEAFLSWAKSYQLPFK
ncbi:hypothetical protein BH20ACI2_BH20ACI2_20120 [soil metagenome]